MAAFQKNIQFKRWEKQKEKQEKSLASYKAARRKASNQNEKLAAGKVPLELLAHDWLNEQCASAEQRLYLVENLLPSLVVGLEKLLIEVGVRGLVEDKEENPDFNPINYLAQHLMRNNPKYSNFAEAHPYCRAMHKISEELKKRAYLVETSQLSQLKSDIRKRRAEREEAESARTLEANRREELLRAALSKWMLSSKEELATAEIQLALYSWLQIMSAHSLISTLTDLFSQLFPPDTDPLIREASLITRLIETGEILPDDIFDMLADHLEICGFEYSKKAQREQRRVLFGKLFESCDPDKTGFVDRSRVLHLFNCFYDSAPSDIQDKFHNPRKWPIVEVAEAEELDDDEESQSDSMITSSSLTEEDYQQFLAGTVEKRESPFPSSTDQPTDVKQKSVGDEAKPFPGEGESTQQSPGSQSTQADNGSKSKEEETKPEPQQNESKPVGEESKSEQEQNEPQPVEEETKPESEQNESKPVGEEGKSNESKPMEEEPKAESKQNESQSVNEEAKSQSEQSESDVKLEPKQSEFQPVGEETKPEPEQSESKPEKAKPEPEQNMSQIEEEAKLEPEQNESQPVGEEAKPETEQNVSQLEEEAKLEPEQNESKPGGEEAKPETEQNVSQLEEETKLEPELNESKPVGEEAGTVVAQNESESERDEMSTRTGSVIERRLATAGRYGRSALISAMRRISGMGSQPVSPSGPGSSWDHLVLNCSQFVQLVELFIAIANPPDSILDLLSSYIRDNYTETAEERAERLELAQQQKLILTKRQQINALFEVWDNDHSGYLELEELQLVLGRWKDFSSEQAQEHAREILASLGTQQPRLSRPNFHTYIEQLTENMKLKEFEEFSEYLMTSVKLTFEELSRGEKRKALLDKIYLAGKTSGFQFSKAMKTAIEAIHEDNAEFGGGKSCSVAMALLERLSPSNPTQCLSFKVASRDVSSKVVGRKILRSFKQGVSHKAVNTSRPVCVQNIQKHGGVFFFIREHNEEEYNGSLVVSPIITPREIVVGTFSVDSLRELAGGELDTTFFTHEISFFQGVGVCLGEVFHWIQVHTQLLTASQSALSWVHRRCPQVTQSAMYIVEPYEDSSQQCPHMYALRCMLVTSGPNEHSHTSNLLTREENIFRDYLFRCVDDSEPVVGNAYGQHHLAYPIRDSTGCAVAVLDLCMPPTRSLRPSQLKEVTKVLKLLTLAYYQLSHVSNHEREADASSSSKVVTTRDSLSLLDQDVSVLFDQLMLSDLKQSVSKLDKRVFAEMRSYIDPPPTVLCILQALLYILYPDNDFDTWAKCKQFVTVSLLSDLQDFDPLSCEEPHKRLALIKEIVGDIQAGSVQEQASHPAKYIYGWVDVCLSLLDHAAHKPLLSPSVTEPGLPVQVKVASSTASSPE